MARYLESNWPEDQGASNPPPGHSETTSNSHPRKMAACFALLRGQVYEAMENLEPGVLLSSEFLRVIGEDRSTMRSFIKLLSLSGVRRTRSCHPASHPSPILVRCRWYEQAAHLDPYCHEALDRLAARQSSLGDEYG